MGMDLSPNTLRKIAEKIEVIQAADLNVTQFIVDGHQIWVERHDDQRDGTWYSVRGITNKFAVSGGVGGLMRDAGSAEEEHMLKSRGR